MDSVGDILYGMLSRFVNLPIEPECCSFKLILNAYGPGLVAKNMHSLISTAKMHTVKLPGYRFVEHRIDDRMVELFLRRCLRNMDIDTAKLPRYNSLGCSNKLNKE